MLRVVAVALAAITAGLLYFVSLVSRKRRQMDGLPCPPMKSRFFGHLDIAGECNKLFPPNCHVHNWFHYVQRKYEQGDVFYLDWWPLGPRWLFMSNPELISQYVTTTVSLPKSPLEVIFLNLFLGDNNMVSIEGPQWKHLRSMFNPGFSAAHLMTLVPYIVDASVVFCDVIRDKATTGELFELEEMATRLTIDIIGKVVLDSDFDSQKATHPIVEAFRKRVRLMPKSGPVLDMSWFEFRRRWNLWRNGRELDRLIGDELDRKMASRPPRQGGGGGAAGENAVGQTATKSFKDRKRSVIDLAMDAYEKEQSQRVPKEGRGDEKDVRDSRELSSSSSGTSAGAPMDQTFRQNAIDSMKTFIFAGHDTTASTIAYLFYMLHFHPQVHAKIVTELDTVFAPGATTAEIADAIKRDPYIINRLEYITAAIKETLRVFPPASTLRYIPEGSDSYMTHPKTGQKLPLGGFHIWPTVHLVGRNPAFFPQPMHFIPERFIPSQTPFPSPDESLLFTPQGRDAWRPFEKGPRACIGQELAMIEAKIIVALSVRDLDFVADLGDGRGPIESWTPIEAAEEFKDGRPGKDRMTIEGHRVFQVLLGSAKPYGGMPGRMSFRRDGREGEETKEEMKG